MFKKSVYVFFALMLVLSLGLVACGPTNNDANTANNEPVENTANNAANDTPAEEPAEEAVEEPVVEEPMMDLNGVSVSFWHVYGEGDPRNEAITAIVDEFNATNEYGITVEALDQGQYGDVEDKVNAGIQSGDTPAIVQAYVSALTNWSLVDMVVDLNQFVDSELYGLTADEIADVYPTLYALGENADGVRLGWPLSQSANAMVYNYTWAQELGFDAAPTTPEELKEQLCAAAAANAGDDNPDNDGTGGMVWYASTSNFLSFYHAFGGTELNDAGDAYSFNNAAAADAAAYVNDLRDNDCTFETESYPNPEQANRLALVTLSSTSGLKYYGYAFSDAANEDEWGFLPFPGPAGAQGVDNFTQSIGVMKSTPEQELASWLFIKYLTSPTNQAAWVEASGYLPTQTSTEALLTEYIESNPIFQSTLVLGALGQGEPETFAAWYSVRRAVGDASAELYAATSAEEIATILEALDLTAAELVEEISD